MATIEPRLIHLLNEAQTPDLPPLQLSSVEQNSNYISLPPIEPDPTYRADHAVPPTQIPPLLSIADDALTKQPSRGADNVFPIDPPARAVKAVPSFQELLDEIEPSTSSLPLRRLVDNTPDFQDDLSTKKRHRGATQKDDFMQLPQPLKKQKSTQQVVPPIIAGLHEPPPDPRVFPPINTDGPALFEDYCNIDEDRNIGVLGANASDSGDKTSGTAKGKRRATKPRKKWSDEETNHLLLGVSRYGVGKWTSILEDKDFKFNGRTAGDLKDRFRTCCPDELRGPSTGPGRRQRSGKSGAAASGSSRQGQSDYASASEDSSLYHNASLPKPSKTGVPLERLLIEPPSTTTTASGTPASLPPASTPGATTPTSDHTPRQLTERELLHPLPEGSVPFVVGRNRKSRAHRKKMEDLAELGIHAPFKKSHRRERRPFTEEDDKFILDGLKEYGPAWTKIQRDAKFNLLSRQPTDLRDRVRNKYPEIYASIEKGTPLFGPKSRGGRRKLGEGAVRKISGSGSVRNGDSGMEGGANVERPGESSGWRMEGAEDQDVDGDGDAADNSAGEDERTGSQEFLPRLERDGRSGRGEPGGRLRRTRAAIPGGSLLEPLVKTTIDAGLKQHNVAQDLNRTGSWEQLMPMMEGSREKGEQLAPRVPTYEPVSDPLPAFADMFDGPKGFGPPGGAGGLPTSSFPNPSDMDLSRLWLDDASSHGNSHPHHLPQITQRPLALPLPHNSRYAGGPGSRPGHAYDRGVGK